MREITRRSIDEYYSQTYVDYRVAWTRKSASACHFGFYDLETRGHAAALLRANERVADLAQIGDGYVVVDAGCGLGGTSLWLAEQRKATVIGIGLNPRQTVRATKSANERGLKDRVKFVVGDYLQMPLGDRVADAVIAIESLCHAADKLSFFREAARVLRPGGHLVIADFMRRDCKPNATESLLMSDWLSGWAMPGLATPAEHRTYAGAAGFSEVKVQDVTPNVEKSLQRLYRLTLLGFPVHWAMKALGLRSEIQGANLVASRRQYQTMRRGLWSYCHLHARL